MRWNWPLGARLPLPRRRCGGSERVGGLPGRRRWRRRRRERTGHLLLVRNHPALGVCVKLPQQWRRRLRRQTGREPRRRRRCPPRWAAVMLRRRSTRAGDAMYYYITKAGNENEEPGNGCASLALHRVKATRTCITVDHAPRRATQHSGSI